MNTRVLGKGLELLRVDGGRFEINTLLFAEGVAIVADPDDKLRRLVSELGRICKRGKLFVDVHKNKVTRCSSYINVGRLDVRLYCQPLDENGLL